MTAKPPPGPTGNAVCKRCRQPVLWVKKPTGTGWCPPLEQVPLRDAVIVSEGRLQAFTEPLWRRHTCTRAELATTAKESA